VGRLSCRIPRRAAIGPTVGGLAHQAEPVTNRTPNYAAGGHPPLVLLLSPLETSPSSTSRTRFTAAERACATKGGGGRGQAGPRKGPRAARLKESGGLMGARIFARRPNGDFGGSHPRGAATSHEPGGPHAGDITGQAVERPALPGAACEEQKIQKAFFPGTPPAIRPHSSDRHCGRRTAHGRACGLGANVALLQDGRIDTLLGKWLRCGPSRQERGEGPREPPTPGRCDGGRGRLRIAWGGHIGRTGGLAARAYANMEFYQFHPTPCTKRRRRTLSSPRRFARRGRQDRRLRSGQAVFMGRGLTTRAPRGFAWRPATSSARAIGRGASSATGTRCVFWTWTAPGARVVTNRFNRTIYKTRAKAFGRGHGPTSPSPSVPGGPLTCCGRTWTTWDGRTKSTGLLRRGRGHLHRGLQRRQTAFGVLQLAPGGALVVGARRRRRAPWPAPRRPRRRAAGKAETARGTPARRRSDEKRWW